MAESVHELCVLVASGWPASESRDTLLFVDLNVPDNRDINGALFASRREYRSLIMGWAYDGIFGLPKTSTKVHIPRSSCSLFSWNNGLRFYRHRCDPQVLERLFRE
ncbi:hypothetical protein QLX08_010905 [Tetragonisca angustula]|uniref:Uncharacterized protein n=1 Tax=Tetragonisca angustula TaxID=166442 RepID=A0AAW0ZCA1_9HYME